MTEPVPAIDFAADRFSPCGRPTTAPAEISRLFTRG
jgi:hypothetical protein